MADSIQLPADLHTWLTDRATGLNVSFEDALLEALYFAKATDDAQRLEAAKAGSPSETWAGIERELQHRNRHR